MYYSYSNLYYAMLWYDYEYLVRACHAYDMILCMGIWLKVHQLHFLKRKPWFVEHTLPEGWNSMVCLTCYVCFERIVSEIMVTSPQQLYCCITTCYTYDVDYAVLRSVSYRLVFISYQCVSYRIVSCHIMIWHSGRLILV